MRRFILIAFVGTFLMRNVTLFKVHKYSSNLEWLFNSRKLSNNEEQKRTVCESEGCTNMANFVLGNMNKSVNPCDDFYEYACGRWPEQNPIPKEYVQWSVMNLLQINKTNPHVQEILEAEPKEDDLTAIKLVKKWYKTCMDTDAIEKQGIGPLVSTLTRLGGWPMTMEPDEWNEQEDSWQKVDDQYMRLTGSNAFYDVRIDEITKDPKVVEIDTPDLPPGSEKLYFVMESDEEDDDDKENVEEQSKNDEDPSNEGKQSNEEQEAGSEGEDNSKFVDNDNDSDDDDSDDDYNDIDVDGSGFSPDDEDDSSISGGSDDNDDNDKYDDTNEKRKTDKKKIGQKENIKIGHRRSKKLRHVEQGKSGTGITKKHNSHKTRRQRIKRQTEVDIKRQQRFIHHENSHIRKDDKQRRHVRKVHMKRTKKIVDNEEMAKMTNKQKKIALKKMILKRYIYYVSKVAHIIAKERGTKISRERLNKDVEDMLEFQTRLFEINSVNLMSSLPVSLRGFQKWYDEKKSETTKSKINWVNKIKALFDEAYESVNDDLYLNIISPSYIESLISLLDETSNRTIVNYIHWNFISKIIKTTTSEMTKLYNAWHKFSAGLPWWTKNRERSDICKEPEEINTIIMYEYVRRYFSDDKLRAASNMIKDIKEAEADLIKKSDWMDEKAKNFALEKVKYLKGLIGHPNWYKNTTIFQEYFKDLIIGSSYYENTIRYDRYVKLKGLRKLSNRNNEIQFFEETDPDGYLNSTDVNAYFRYELNTLFITTADFQSPWYAAGRPRSVNFGTLGFLIAHETNHGFDDTV
ncbi:endothelin-converting enzyme homolog isoform X2 [Solenopsis invicta]|uniref:endothelin-converting enzyme homolog isoform X2 n=1 Tax=Solenopsis invicta TaxID=13686 RepID=UPI00193CC8FD|nr:endothelin-converting enzyme homolog isoform X2 [Solenopsis invicta]